MPDATTLDLAELAAGCGCITPRWGAGLAEAASVCLDAQGHQSPEEFEVSGAITHRHTLHWLAVDDQMRRCFNDLDDAAEHGAYGIAALLVEEHTPFEVVDRSRKGTGFDYWLGPKGTDGGLFDAITGRLEVSGIGRGSLSVVNARVRKKLKQTSPTDALGLPAYVVVVEYGTPLARVADK
jgi:hypothetical protein